eukprot:scaffold1786_cov138-Cylindrotheca_fusiformis.AAC.15
MLLCYRGQGKQEQSDAAANASIALKVHCQTEITASDLERALVQRLVRPQTNNDYDVDDDDDCDNQYGIDEETVYLPPRWDSHHLKCQTPHYGTLLGIAEDFHDPELEDHVTLNVVGYHQAVESAVDAQRREASCCTCRQAPHSEWKRQELSYSPPLEEDDDDDDYAKKKVALAWVDLRSAAVTNNNNSFTSSKASVFHLLRSLLSSNHDVSPWQNTNDNNKDTSTSIAGDCDMVVLVLPESSPILRNFRVSDAAPSWMLQAYAACQTLEPWEFWKNPTGGGGRGYLYIFKKLAHRHLLSSTAPHPEETDSVVSPPTTTTVGCLWETVEIKPNGEGNGGDEKEDKKDSKERRTIVQHRLVCPPYLSLQDEYDPDVISTLFDPKNLEIFRQEALQIPLWTPWPETQHYSVSSSAHADDPEKPWTVFPLCYCFPANQPENITWVTSTQGFCPNTCRILKSLNGLIVRTALFSQLAPETTLEAHTGWADLANHVLRLHIPLVVPDNNNASLCGTWVDGCVETHQEGRPLLFDDSKIHRAFNYHPTDSRVVLIVDLARPEGLPKGYATGGHSEELDSFIQQMSAPR